VVFLLIYLVIAGATIIACCVALFRVLFATELVEVSAVRETWIVNRKKNP